MCKFITSLAFVLLPQLALAGMLQEPAAPLLPESMEECIQFDREYTAVVGDTRDQYYGCVEGHIKSDDRFTNVLVGSCHAQFMQAGGYARHDGRERTFSDCASLLEQADCIDLRRKQKVENCLLTARVRQVFRAIAKKSKPETKAGEQFDKVYDQFKKNVADKALGPDSIVKRFTQRMLDIVAGTYRQNLDRLTKKLKEPSPMPEATIAPVPPSLSSPSSSHSLSSDGDADCGILLDERASRAFLERDGDAWLRLMQRCRKP
jgi:hypothetical protein